MEPLPRQVCRTGRGGRQGGAPPAAGDGKAHWQRRQHAAFPPHHTSPASQAWQVAVERPFALLSQPSLPAPPAFLPSGGCHPCGCGGSLRHHSGHAVRPGCLPAGGHRCGDWRLRKGTGRQAGWRARALAAGGTSCCTCCHAWISAAAVAVARPPLLLGLAVGLSSWHPPALLRPALPWLPTSIPPKLTLPVRLPCPPAPTPAAGPGGAVSAMEAGKGYVDVSTVDAQTAQQVGGWAGWCCAALILPPHNCQIPHASSEKQMQSPAAAPGWCSTAGGSSGAGCRRRLPGGPRQRQQGAGGAGAAHLPGGRWVGWAGLGWLDVRGRGG